MEDKWHKLQMLCFKFWLNKIGYIYFYPTCNSNIIPLMLFPHVCDGLMSVCSVKVIDLSIRQ